MNILITTPSRGSLFTEAQEAIEREYRENSLYPLILRTNGLPLLAARNDLATRALQVPGWDILIMVDDDILLPEGSFKAIAKTLEKSDIALIDYPHHHHELLSVQPPTSVTVFTQYLEGEVSKDKEIAWSGLGATAMKRSTLEAMMDEYTPLFKATAHPVFVDDLGRVSLRATKDKGIAAQKSDYSAGEDTQFFFDARRMALTIKLVPDMIAHHLRLDFAVSWANEDKYNTSHTIERSHEISQPGNMLHILKEN